MTALLAVETSSPVLSLALKDPKGKVHTCQVKGLMKHAEEILPQIEALFKKSKTSWKDLGAFLIGRGPGSFTGLRVGFATLKGFLTGGDVSCFGALSLDLIAENKTFEKLPEGAKLAVALDAFRERIYFRLYEQDEGNWTAENKTQILSIDETLKALPAGAWITGNALAKYEASFKSLNAEKKIHWAAEADWFPQAAALIEFFERQDPKLEKLPRENLLPFYFRLSEAEERMRPHVPAC